MDTPRIEKVVIMIPTYNEELVIAETIKLIFEETHQIHHGYVIHILIFDSASLDQTQSVVKDLQLKYTHLHLQTEAQKTGLGSAYHQAMHYALHHLDADILVEFDADLSHQPKYLIPMLEKIKEQDVVVGSRYIPGGSLPENWGLHRRLLSKMGNLLIKSVLKVPYQDLTSGFRMIRREALLKVIPQAFISSCFAYKIDLYWRLFQEGMRIQEHPIEFIDRTKGSSKLPKGSIMDSLRVLYHLSSKESS